MNHTVDRFPPADNTQLDEWLDRLKRQPLYEIVQLIDARSRTSAEGSPRALAERFELIAPDRIDYTLFRALYGSAQHRQSADLELTVRRALDLADRDRGVVWRGIWLSLQALNRRHISGIYAHAPDLILRLQALFDQELPECQHSWLPSACEAVLRPHIRFLLWEEVARASNDEQVPRAYWAQTETLIRSVHRNLSIVLNGAEAVKHGFRIPGVVDRYPHTDCLWTIRDALITVAIGMVDVGAICLFAPWTALAGAEWTSVTDILDKASEIVQGGWLTLRQFRRHHFPGSTRIANTVRRREVKALSILAQLERVRGNHARAAQYAALALMQRSDPNIRTNSLSEESFADCDVSDALADTLLTGSECSTLYTIAKGSGIAAPKPPSRAVVGLPPVHGWLILHDPQLRSDVAILDEVMKGRQWWPGTTRWTRDAIDGGDSLSIVRSAIAISIKAGNIGVVRDLILSKDTEGDQLRRRKVFAAATPQMLFEFSDAVADVQQRAAIFATEGETFRAAVRKLWAELTADSLSNQESLFIHHVKAGLAYHAMSNHRNRAKAALALYESAPPNERNTLLDEFAESVRFEPVRPLRLRDFRNGRVRVGPREVFISLVTRPGDVLSLLCYGPSKSERELVPTAADDVRAEAKRIDWHVAIHNWHERAKDAVRCGDRIESDRSIDQLGNHVAEAIRTVNPRATRILLHADSMLRLIPWQWLLQRFGLGRRCSVWHVQGVRCFKSEINANTEDGSAEAPHGVQLIYDKDDSICIETATNIGRCWATDAGDGRVSQVSIVCHGRHDSVAARIEMARRRISANEMRNLCAGARVGVVHACHAGYAYFNRLGDMGGIPGFLAGHGTETVFASPLPVRLDSSVTLETFLAMRRDDGTTALEAAYLDSIEHNPSCAYFSLYSGRLGPILERVANPELLS